MNNLLRTALEAAESAAAIHRRDRGRILVEQASEKGRADYVSRADFDAQRAALDVILAHHPDHTVLSEEDERPVEERLAEWDGSPLWVVDPLDGTSNFLHGHPQHAASVAVAVDGRPVAGAVVCATTGERWWAARDEGACKNGVPIRVSPPRRLRDALLGTGFPFKLQDRLPLFLNQLDRVLRNSAGIRRAGSAAMDLCYVAQGSLDGFWELVLSPWDFAAGWLIVEEAGGVITKLDGSPLELGEVPLLVASTQELHHEMSKLLG